MGTTNNAPGPLSVSLPVAVWCVPDVSWVHRGIRALAVLVVFSFVFSFFYMAGRGDARDHSSLKIAYAIETLGVLAAAWALLQTRAPVLRFTEDGLEGGRRWGFASGVRRRKFSLKWSDVADLQVRQQTEQGIGGVGAHTVPLKYVWIFRGTAPESPIILDLEGLTRKPAEVLQLLKTCAAGGLKTGMNTALGPVEIRYGVKAGLICLGRFVVFGVVTAFLVCGTVYVHQTGHYIAQFILAAAGLWWGWECVRMLYFGGRCFVSRVPQLILGEDALHDRRQGVSIPWREIAKADVQTQTQRWKEIVVAAPAGKITITFPNGSPRARMLLDVSYLDQDPDRVYFLVKSRIPAMRR